MITVRNYNGITGLDHNSLTQRFRMIGCIINRLDCKPQFWLEQEKVNFLIRHFTRWIYFVMFMRGKACPAASPVDRFSHHQSLDREVPDGAQSYAPRPTSCADLLPSDHVRCQQQRFTN